MQIEVRPGYGGAPFGLAHALLIYTDGTRSFATIHDPVSPASKKEAPALGPGRMVTTAFVKTLAKQLGESVSPDVLPENVLVRTADVTVWWRPASADALFYNPAKNEALTKELKAINGKRVPIPPLVFRATSTGLWIRALRENRRPIAETRLCTAPFYNVSALGGVCLGSMRRPHGRGLETLPQWERSFFESEFTHILPRVVPANYPKTADSFPAMWAMLARDLVRAKPNSSLCYFPTDYLVPAPQKQTLAAFVTQAKVGQL